MNLNGETTLIVSTNHFWDTCVLTRHCLQDNPELLGDIATILDQARAGNRKIWYSTLLNAELRPSQLRQSARYPDLQTLFREFEGILLPVNPNDQILARAGRIRDHSFELPLGVRQAGEKPKILPTPDAIQLATALYVKEALGVEDLEFHTFDDGKGKKAHEDGRAVSLLRFEEYATEISDPDVRAVCRLRRLKPQLAHTPQLV